MKKPQRKSSLLLPASSFQLPASKGSFVLLVLVFSAVFLTLLSALTGYLFVQQRAEYAKQNRERAINIAEAGLEYYRWYLAHFPNDLTNGTGLPGPYEHVFEDPETGETGTFSLELDGNYQCGSPTTISIESTGWSANDPSYRRTLFARYARPSVAEFAYVINSNVWAGSDRVISGRYHSNGGIRMDGTSNSTVSSGVSSWLCTGSFGCTPNQTVNGVFGSGSPQELWSYPAAPVNFAGITTDLAALQDLAEADGLYIGPAGGSYYGYHLVFQADRTVTVYRVTGTTQVWGYTTQYGWQLERPVIASETFLATYPIPEDCGVVFVEDDIWVEGVVSGKVTLAAADVDTANVERGAILPGNITYATGVGTDGLTVIGEQNVLIGLTTPDSMTLNGIFIAQNGRFGRNHYCQDNCSGSGTSGDTGLRTAGAVPVSTGWSNLTVSRLSASDNSRASCSSTCDDNDDGQLADFSFTIPAGAAITGIQVRAEMAEAANSGSISTRFSLSWDGGASFTSTKSVTVDGTGDTTYTAGGSSDTWGRTWSESDFANGSFRVRLDKVADADTLNVDYLTVRVYYTTGYGLPSSLDPYVFRSSLSVNGTIVSNGREGSKWTSGGVWSSGYNLRTNSYDRDLAEDPPPFTPNTSSDYRFVEWQEESL